MDKEWIHLPSRLVPEYEEGVQKFIAQAKDYAKARDVILCPCIRCKNKKYMTFDKVYEHLIIKGFDPSYTIWFFHGETDTPQFEGEDSLEGVQEAEDESREAFHLYRDVFVSDEGVGHTTSDARDYEFADLLEDAETPLFPGCTTYTKLSASVTLCNYKSTNGHTDKYATFLGCMVKEFVPYTLDRWNDLDEEMKNNMWCCLQLNYKVEEWEKHSIFQKLGKLWRDRKSKLQILIREVDGGRVASRDLCLLKPEFMDQNQWDLFVKKTLSQPFQEKSERFKAMREKRRYNHTMSRRGYARLAHIMEQTSSADIPITRTKVWVEGHKKKNGQPSGEVVGEKMKEIEECEPESQNTTNIAEDAISIVFGKEIRGRVRGMGFGVTPSKVGASLQQNGTIKQLQSMMHSLQQEVQQMRFIIFQNMRQQNEQEHVSDL